MLVWAFLAIAGAVNAWRGAARDADVEQRLRSQHHWLYELQSDVTRLREERDELAHRLVLLETCE